MSERTWRPPVSIRRPVTRVLLGGASLGAGALAVVGGLALGGAGLVGVGIAATLAACTAAGIAREAPAHLRGSAVEAAVWAAGCTAGVVLVVAGVSTVAGGAVATLAVVAAVCAAVGVAWGRRKRGLSGTAVERDRKPAGDVLQLPVGPHPDSSTGSVGDRRPVPVPVATLSTRALGDEWLRTTAALAGRLTSAARTSLVRRREEALDELERRDPEGFARWLAAGPDRGSDPADFVRGGPAQRGPVADTDAA
jgi:hypothetical protein